MEDVTKLSLWATKTYCDRGDWRVTDLVFGGQALEMLDAQILSKYTQVDGTRITLCECNVVGSSVRVLQYIAV